MKLPSEAHPPPRHQEEIASLLITRGGGLEGTEKSLDDIPC